MSLGNQFLGPVSRFSLCRFPALYSVDAAAGSVLAVLDLVAAFTLDADFLGSHGFPVKMTPREVTSHRGSAPKVLSRHGCELLLASYNETWSQRETFPLTAQENSLILEQDRKEGLK